MKEFGYIYIPQPRGFWIASTARIYFYYICNMALFYSFIIPVYNRPDEVRELLHSISELKFEEAFEVVIVEDGSTISSGTVVKKFADKLDITYLPTSNTGPGDSRNYGMRNAR